MKIKKLIPKSLKRKYFSIKRSRVLHRTISSLKSKSGNQVSRNDLQNLIEGWGNPSWSADANYLEEVLRYTESCKGNVLECGSGLTSLVMGLFAKDATVYCLENNLEWRQKISKTMQRYNVKNVVVCYTPIIDYGEYSWYDTAKCPAELTNVEVVICDGPPGSTKGGRYGLLPAMLSNMAKQVTVLLDDTVRKEEMDVICKWQQDFSVVKSVDHKHPYSILTISK